MDDAPKQPAKPADKSADFKDKPKGRTDRRQNKKTESSVILSASKILQICSVQLPFTTPVAGLLTQMLFYLLDQNVVNVNCTRFQFYRIILYSFSDKLTKQLRIAAPWIQQLELPLFILEQIASLLITALHLPEPFAKYTEHADEFEIKSLVATIFVSNFQGPHPLFVTMSNIQV